MIFGGYFKWANRLRYYYKCRGNLLDSDWQALLMDLMTSNGFQMASKPQKCIIFSIVLVILGKFNFTNGLCMISGLQNGTLCMGSFDEEI